MHFYPTLKKQIQLINPLKTDSKVDDLPQTIAMTAHCFRALAQVRAAGHCVIGQEHELLWPDWLNWWVWWWVTVFEIQIFLIHQNPGTHRQMWCNWYNILLRTDMLRIKSHAIVYFGVRPKRHHQQVCVEFKMVLTISWSTARKSPVVCPYKRNLW